MLWKDKLREWACDEATKALKENLWEAIVDIQQGMVYEEDNRKLAIMQGMTRAYMDIIDVIDNLDLEELGESNEPSDE